MDDEFAWIKVEADSEGEDFGISAKRGVLVPSSHEDTAEIREEDDSNVEIPNHGVTLWADGQDDSSSNDVEISKESKILTPSPDDTGWIEESDDEEDSGFSGNNTKASLNDPCSSASKKPPERLFHQKSSRCKTSNICDSEQEKRCLKSDEFNGQDSKQTLENSNTSMFGEKTSLNVHERKHTGEIIDSCVALNEFNKTVHPEVTGYKCTVLGKSFTFTNFINIGGNSFLCNDCDSFFSTLDALKSHERLHEHEDKIYKCNYCSKSFHDSDMLDTDERTYKCRYCSKSFNRSCNMKRHERLHSGEKPYECKDCGKFFSQSGNLKKHKKRDICERSVLCRYCGESFKNFIDLKRHERLHIGEKPYNCKWCNKSFKCYSLLKKHERTHTGEKPYKCKYCGKTFSQNGTLKRHEATHVGERPYKCEHCGQLFTRTCSLKKHGKSGVCKRQMNM